MAQEAADDPIGSYDARNHPAQLVRRAHQRAAQLFTQAVQYPNLSATQFVALVTLLRHGPMTLGQLARLTSMDTSTTTVVVRKLEKDALITRARSDQDQRASVIALTPAGQDCARDHIPVSIHAGEALLAPLTPVERVLLIELLRKLMPDES